MSAIDAVKAHFKQFGVQSLFVPEWELTVYWNPLTMIEAEKLGPRNHIGFRIFDPIEVVVAKALDENGKRMFDASHKPDLRRAADPRILQRLCDEMIDAPKMADAEKNSGPIPG